MLNLQLIGHHTESTKVFMQIIHRRNEITVKRANNHFVILIVELRRFQRFEGNLRLIMSVLIRSVSIVVLSVGLIGMHITSLLVVVLHIARIVILRVEPVATPIAALIEITAVIPSKHPLLLVFATLLLLLVLVLNLLLLLSIELNHSLIVLSLVESPLVSSIVHVVGARRLRSRCRLRFGSFALSVLIVVIRCA